jgi:hypothetical protein
MLTRDRPNGEGNKSGARPPQPLRRWRVRSFQLIGMATEICEDTTAFHELLAQELHKSDVAPA